MRLRNSYVYLLVVLLLISVMVIWQVRGAVNQQKLDQQLIAAVHDIDSARVDALLQQGANPNVCDPPLPQRTLWDLLNDFRHRRTVVILGGTPLLLSYLKERTFPAIQGTDTIENTEMVTMLLDHGANINAVNLNGQTALMLAASTRQEKTVHLLLQRGAEITIRDSSGKTFLFYALISSKLPIITEVIDRGVDINAQDRNGWTALMIAAMIGRGDIVQFLISRGANVNRKDVSGRSALKYALLYGRSVSKANFQGKKQYQQVVAILRKAGAIEPPPIPKNVPLVGGYRIP